MFKWIRPAVIVLATGLIASTGFAQQRHTAPHGPQATQHHARSPGHAQARKPRARASQLRRAHPKARHARPLARGHAYRGPGHMKHRAQRHNRRFRAHQWQRNHRPSLRHGHKSRRPARHLRPLRRS